jgi:hypothetical protein
MTIKAASRRAIDMSIHAKMIYPTCFIPDHVTLRDWSARFVSKYFNGLPILQAVGFSQSFRGDIPRRVAWGNPFSRSGGYVHTWICSPQQDPGRICTFVLRLLLIICHYGTMPYVPCKSETGRYKVRSVVDCAKHIKHNCCQSTECSSFLFI